MTSKQTERMVAVIFTLLGFWFLAELTTWRQSFLVALGLGSIWLTAVIINRHTR